MPTIDVKDRARLELAQWVDRADEQVANAKRQVGAVWQAPGQGQPR
jgi:uncharacterized protein (DUF934 family)